MQYSQEHLKTMVYAEFGGQTECIMGNSKIENSHWLQKKLFGKPVHFKGDIFGENMLYCKLFLINKELKQQRQQQLRKCQFKVAPSLILAHLVVTKFSS